KLRKRVTMFLKNTCSMIGIDVPDMLIGICIAENRNADRHISTAPFCLLGASLREAIGVTSLRYLFQLVDAGSFQGMLDTVSFLGSLGIVPVIHSPYQISGYPSYSFERNVGKCIVQISIVAVDLHIQRV